MTVEAPGHFDCPVCGERGTKVTDSRQAAISRGQYVRRRRECLHCAHRFTTWEGFDEPVARQRSRIVQTIVEAVQRIAKDVT